MTTFGMAEKGAMPALRGLIKRGEKWVETAALWASSNPESKAVMTGYIDLGIGQTHIPVFAFVNDRKDKEGEPGGKFISLSSPTTNHTTGEITYVRVAMGNLVNTRADGEAVFYDTVIFNAIDKEGKPLADTPPISVRVTDACDTTLHSKLGFTHARLPRPPKEAHPVLVETREIHEVVMTNAASS